MKSTNVRRYCNLNVASIPMQLSQSLLTTLVILSHNQFFNKIINTQYKKRNFNYRTHNANVSCANLIFFRDQCVY